jgi:hypothetical protein
MDCQDNDLDKVAKGWSIAMFYSKERLRRVYELDDAQLNAAVKDGKLVLETVCLFVHACIKRGQYKYVERAKVQVLSYLLIVSFFLFAGCRLSFGACYMRNMALLCIPRL